MSKDQACTFDFEDEMCDNDLRPSEEHQKYFKI